MSVEGGEGEGKNREKLWVRVVVVVQMFGATKNGNGGDTGWRG